MDVRSSFASSESFLSTPCCICGTWFPNLSSTRCPTYSDWDDDSPCGIHTCSAVVRRNQSSNA